MMSLVEAVSFRHLSNQLTASERGEFIARLSNTNILFDALYTHIATSKNQNTAERINSTLSNIIVSRKEKPESQCDHTSLSSIPRHVVGSIASFLKQREYAWLSQASRSIFLACNSPNHLQEMDLLESTSLVNLSRYTSIRRLHLNLRQFSEFDQPLSVPLPLREIVLVGFEALHFLSHWGAPIDLSPVNFSKLRELRIRGKNAWASLQGFATATNLLKISLTDCLEPEHAKSAVAGIIMKCKALKHIELGIWLQLGVGRQQSSSTKLSSALDALDGIEHGLYQTKQQHRKSLKIKVSTRDVGGGAHRQSDAVIANQKSELMLRMHRITHWLESSNIDDYMLAIGSMWIQLTYAELQVISSSTDVTTMSNSYFISKQQSRIDRVYETWLMRTFYWD